MLFQRRTSHHYTVLYCRLHQLVTRYNDVDPGEHRLLDAKNKETESSLLAANQALAALQATVRKEGEKRLDEKK